MADSSKEQTDEPLARVDAPRLSGSALERASLKPPFNRVIVVSRQVSGDPHDESPAFDTIESKYIELGQLDALTQQNWKS